MGLNLGFLSSCPLLAAAVIGLAGCGAGATTTVVQQTTITRTVTASISAPRRLAGPGQTYTGNGTKTIGTITISRPSTIEWSCTGCAAFAFTSHLSGTSAIDVGSKASSGTSAIDPGRYPDAQVISDGDWRIRIVPG